MAMGEPEKGEDKRKGSKQAAYKVGEKGRGRRRGRLGFTSGRHPSALSGPSATVPNRKTDLTLPMQLRTRSSGGKGSANSDRFARPSISVLKQADETAGRTGLARKMRRESKARAFDQHFCLPPI
ncbi:hypothetical protein MTO96_040647 [Rhipicephalus appendiculatus]